tara:strand:+ start:948 stop:1784 length:837 start_codon:yes stop_codon:yes gene_type:complete
MSSLRDPSDSTTGFWCVRLDSSVGRWYAYEREKLGVYFPSVTTVLGALNKGKGFEMWLGNSPSYEHAMEYGLEAAHIGSIVHYYIFILLEGSSVDTKQEFIDEETGEKTKTGRKVNKRLEGFVKFYEDHKPTLLANEVTLFNEAKYKKEYLFPWAGQADQVYEIDGKIVMCDNKTGKSYDSHGLQLTAYKLLWDSLFPDKKIDELWGLYLSDKWIKKPYTIKKYKFEPEMWLNVLDVWLWQNNGSRLKIPQPKQPKPETTFFELNIDKKEGDPNDGKL